MICNLKPVRKSVITVSAEMCIPLLVSSCSASYSHLADLPTKKSPHRSILITQYNIPQPMQKRRREDSAGVLIFKDLERAKAVIQNSHGHHCLHQVGTIWQANTAATKTTGTSLARRCRR